MCRCVDLVTYNKYCSDHNGSSKGIRTVCLCKRQPQVTWDVVRYWLEYDLVSLAPCGKREKKSELMCERFGYVDSTFVAFEEYLFLFHARAISRTPVLGDDVVIADLESRFQAQVSSDLKDKYNLKNELLIILRVPAPRGIKSCPPPLLRMHLAPTAQFAQPATEDEKLAFLSQSLLYFTSAYAKAVREFQHPAHHLSKQQFRHMCMNDRTTQEFLDPPKTREQLLAEQGPPPPTGIPNTHLRVVADAADADYYANGVYLQNVHRRRINHKKS